MKRLLALLLCAAGAAPAQEAAPPPWDAELTDPAGGADLMLPMPCGGAMAFQKVLVPVEAGDPLDDRAFRMGQSEPATGYSDYLRGAHLRGAFADPGSGGSAYYIARYEMNEAQYRALAGDCGAPFGRRDRLAHGGLSWFEAVDLSRRYSEWLNANARDQLPGGAERGAFLRLPTEEEWEYAVRGGARIDSAQFPARRFFAEGELGDYAHYQAAGQGRGNLRPVGLRAPNPLGLFDVYGNAEELVEDPFRLNAVGRPHGQAGGIVTRGGSIDAEAGQIYSAQRREYPRFDPRSGQALAGQYFGLRLAISAPVITDAGFDAIRDGWIADSEGAAPETSDPLATLSSLMENEIDPRRRDALAGLQHEFRLAQDAAEQSLLQSAKSTMLSGAAFVAGLKEGEAEMQRLRGAINDLRDRFEITSNSDQRAVLLAGMRTNVERLTTLQEAQETSLLFYRRTLEALSENLAPEMRQAAYLDLGRELGSAELLELLSDVNSFWGDVNAYAARPDMDLAGLLAMALD
ncbi:SUMF1/EgtB/PvdO family nonheme iron enzyme [Mangrovicoccus sp. HB161399]|uniref:formylglycine-generating enzyme family protein n=1 Tax=Mangrovicoccus sp. HB161399 TaxID=2720392 RepID=UPI00155445FB|nr:SUMF1/EgtB/PvdO family nonheme iron enzyme [Mangrovicoccus sp. HB161399]